jgi:hypothetical protein
MQGGVLLAPAFPDALLHDNAVPKVSGQQHFSVIALDFLTPSVEA